MSVMGYVGLDFYYLIKNIYFFLVPPFLVKITFMFVQDQLCLPDQKKIEVFNHFPSSFIILQVFNLTC